MRETKGEEEKEPKKSTKVDDLKAAYKAKQAEFNEHERIYKEKDTFFNSKVTDDDKKKFARLYSESEAAKAAYIAEAEKQGVSVDLFLSYNTNQEIKAEKTSKLTYNLNIKPNFF